jgi:anti-sigma regulatory factor (Ser/Thr protein kinase)
MVQSKITFELKNDIQELDKLCRILDRFGNSHGFSQKAAFEINLVLEEIFTNIVHYGFADKTEHVVHISLSYDNGLVIIRIEDNGIPFNPLTSEPPDLDRSVEERDIGGLGIHLIKGYTNGIEYQRRGELNILTIKKNIC